MQDRQVVEEQEVSLYQVEVRLLLLHQASTRRRVLLVKEDLDLEQVVEEVLCTSIHIITPRIVVIGRVLLPQVEVQERLDLLISIWITPVVMYLEAKYSLIQVQTIHSHTMVL
jgi:hypothetical protein